ncbi:CatB-related O-acetyltransferase [Treponema primitia]|nr:CatB-related O-acetyltransferase [Treponema primitia]
MENNELPDPDMIFPIPNLNMLINIKPTIKNKNIIVGDFTYFSGDDFEKQVTHHYEWLNDKLIIGKFCQIAAGVEFIMNGANHQMNCVSTFPFNIFKKWNEIVSPDEIQTKGDTIIGNDVWIGQNSTILPGIKIGDGAIIGTRSVVGRDVEPYTIMAGNPAKIIRKRFGNELIEIMLKLKWWDLPVSEIRKLIPILHNKDIEYVKEELKKALK